MVCLFFSCVLWTSCWFLFSFSSLRDERAEKMVLFVLCAWKKCREDWKKSGELWSFCVSFVRNFTGNHPCRPIAFGTDPFSWMGTAEEWRICFLLLVLLWSRVASWRSRRSKEKEEGFLARSDLSWGLLKGNGDDGQELKFEKRKRKRVRNDRCD